MADLALTNDELKANLAMVLGIARDPDVWSSVETADVNRIIRAGRRKFFGAHSWSFLITDYTLVVPAPTELEGSCASGVVTLSSGSWPSDPTDYRLVQGSNSYEIASFSDPLATLADTSIDFDDGAFKLHQVRFDLPSNFAAMESPVTIENQSSPLRELSVLPDYTIRAAFGMNAPKTGRPQLFSTSRDVTDEAVGLPAYFLTVWPLPDAQYVCTARIRIQPEDALTEANAVGHSLFSEALQTAILSSAEVLYAGAPGVYTQQWPGDLARAIDKDKRARGVRSLRGADRPRQIPWWQDVSEITDIPSL